MDKIANDNNAAEITAAGHITDKKTAVEISAAEDNTSDISAMEINVGDKAVMEKAAPEKFSIEIPEFCLVAMVGGTSSGKTSFAKKYFKPTEVLSSDFFRGMVSDDENDQGASNEAFDLLYHAAALRLSRMKLTVIDATNLHKNDRKKVLDLAREQNVHAAAIVLNLPPEILLNRNSSRPERNYPERVIRQHCREVRQSIRNLKKEGFRFVYVINSPEQLQDVEIVRKKLWNNKKDLHGPFDIIGDIHGCMDELELLLGKLGYRKEDGVYSHPEGRTVLFLGDFCDRGERNTETLRLAMDMVKAGKAMAVPGNHDVKLLKYLRGKNISISNGIDRTIAEAEGWDDEFRAEAAQFIDSLVSHYVLDDGKLIVAHAGLKEEYIGRGSGRVREFCLYGETTGETDSYGFPVRLDWAANYRGRGTIVYGHIAGAEVRVENGTYCIDTGCVYGGKLTAFRYPERELVSVDALKQYYEPLRPMGGDPESAEAEEGMGDMLTVDDFNKKMLVETSLIPSVSIREENAAAALESMSRFAADPHWLIYLPPTMSPCRTSKLEDYLEHPLEAFAYYGSRGVRHVVCEQKHMGSRAVIILCRTVEAARDRFGIRDGSRGIIYTRTGRRFFDEENVDAILSRLDKVLSRTGFWEAFKTDWVCLDAEIMPWSDKALKLLKTQYAATGSAGLGGLSAAVKALEEALARDGREDSRGEVREDGHGSHQGDYSSDSQEAQPGQRDGHGSDKEDCPSDAQDGSGSLGDGGVTVPSSRAGTLSSGKNSDLDLSELLARFKDRQEDIRKYTEAYRRYCWTVGSIDDYRIAPFHLLACEGRVFSDEGHVWHMETIRKYITGVDPVFMETPYILVDTQDEKSVKEGTDWWLRLTESGGEGMVVKPESFIAKQGASLLQPAVKCRGREYLRIIYGAEYLEPAHLSRLKTRSLSRKQALALKEFALGMEALDRFVRRDPLYKVHECAFSVLAYESEAVDPRL